jgi:hypothetical protein
MDGPAGGGGALRHVRRALTWVGLAIAAVATALLAGIGVAALLASMSSGDKWSVLANVGESFGALNAIFSGLALAAVVVTFWAQLNELKSQRQELALQRESLTRTQKELYRSAEADIRRLHVELIKMAIDDPVLARVWPLAQCELSPERRRQYLYSNLILQHQRLQVRLGTDAELHSQIRHTFASPIVREYWQNTAGSRAQLLVPGTEEYRFAEAATEVCNEYESVLSQADRHRRDQIGPDEMPEAA